MSGDMKPQELEDLENPDNWDYDNAQKRPGTRNRRSVVSVGFTREDFEKVSQLAEQLGVTVSGFIRYATLEKLTLQTSGPSLTSTDPVTFAIQPVSTTRFRLASTYPEGDIRPVDLLTATEATPARFSVSS